MVSFAGLFHFEKHIGTTKWGPQPTPFQLLIAKVLTNHDRVKLPENMMIDCVRACAIHFLEGHQKKRNDETVSPCMQSLPRPPQKIRTPQLPDGLPHSIFVCVRVWVHAGHGVDRHYRRRRPGKRVSMAVPNVQKATALPPNW